MDKRRASVDLERLRRGLWWVCCGILILGIDISTDVDGFRVDCVSDLVGAAVVIGGVAAIRAASRGVPSGGGFEIAIGGAVASFVRAVCEHSATFDSDFPALVGVLQVAEIVGGVAFCVAMSRLVRVLGWIDLANLWRICAWAVVVLNAGVLLGLLLVKAFESEPGGKGLVVLGLVATIGVLLFQLSCIWRTATRCRWGAPPPTADNSSPGDAAA